MYRYNRMLRIGDGADEVHKKVIARLELNRWAKRAEEESSSDAAAAAPSPQPAKA